MKTKYALPGFLLASSSLIVSTAHAADGDWTTNGNGNWSDTTKWDSATVADGADFTALFTTEFSGNRIVTLDSARTIGNITFTDTTPSHNLTISNNILTLAATGSPTIDITQADRTLTITSQISGINGFTKTGDGRLITTNNNNNYSGNVIVAGGTLQIGTGYGNSWSNENLPSTANLNINGGIVDTGYYAAFNLGAGAGEVQITGGRSGFSNSIQSDATGRSLWRINNDLNTAVVWGASGEGTATGYFNASTLVLNDTGSKTVWRMENNFDLNGADRTIEVASTGSGAGRGTYATMEGDLSNSVGTSAGLVKTGAGTLMLRGANTFDGGTTINDGGLWFDTTASMPATGAVTVNDGAVLSVTVGGSGWTTGTSGSGTIGGLLLGDGGQAGSTVSYNGDVTLGLNISGTRTYAGDIADVGTSLSVHVGNKDGGTASDPFTRSGTLTLSGNNTYTGDTTLYSGTLGLSAANNLGDSSSDLIFNGGSLQILGTSLTSISDLGRTVSFNSGKSVGLDIADAAHTFTVDQVLNQGNGGLTKTGSGSLLLDQVNTYTGATRVDAGFLVAGADALSNTNGAFGKSTGLINLGVANSNNDAGILAGGAYTIGRNIRLYSQNGSDSGSRVITLGGNTADESVFSGGITLGVNGRAGYGVTLTAANGGQATFSGVIQDPSSMDATTYTVTKSGLGSVVLSGINTYTGDTTVSAGTLVVNGSLANSDTTVNSGATVQGSGSIGGSLTVLNGGTLAAGNSIESLATGALSLEAGSTFAYEMDNGAAAGVAGDLTAVTGNLNLFAGALLTLTELGAGSWTDGEKLTLISYDGTWNGGLFDYESTALADDSTFNFSGSNWEINYDDTDAGTNYTGDLTGTRFVTMTAAAVPEPSTIALLGLGGLALILRRRRK